MLLECKNVTKKYMSTTAVSDVSFPVEAGKIYALLGPNGSGKTTLMKMIAGLAKPSAGEITYNGMPIGVESKKDIAYMATEPFFYSYMDVRDVGKYYSDFFEDFDSERYSYLIHKMDLDMKAKVNKLSSGMVAKLKVAATLSRKAKIYMLDEPLNGIDIIARDLIISTIIESSGDDNAMILSSHLVDELEKIIDHAIFIKSGSLVMVGDVEELREMKGKSIVEIYKEVYAYE